MAHIEIEDRQGREFEEQVEPRFVYEARDIHSNGTGVEREDVGILHQREAVASELVADMLRYVVAKSGFQFGHELLELGCLCLLAFCISIIAKQSPSHTTKWYLD